MIINPKFEKSDMYYFDVTTNTIYGRRKFSTEYYHELRHFLDHQNSFYRHLSLLMQVYIEMASMTFMFLFPVYILTNNSMFSFIGVVFTPYVIFIAQEEFRAMFFSYRYSRRDKNGL